MEALVEMGFSKAKAERALAATGHQNADAAVEWLLAHPEVAEAADEDLPAVDAVAATVAAAVAELSEEEKVKRKAAMEEKIKQRRAEKAEQEKREEIEKEKRRMNDGKEMSEARRLQADLEMKKLAEERRREKMDDQMARQRVRDQIEADKQARREKFSAKPADDASSEPAPPSEPAAPTKPTAKQQYTQCRLQMRLTDGSCLTHTFGAKENLSAVRLYINMNRTDGSQDAFNLGTTFPRRVFSDDEYECPLEALDLVPSAVLIVSRR